ncbi:MAG: hypothetical protein GY813_19945 [Halieaceae bacterium]|nr:hypothetical protein [Halieaceae bacterium]
MSNAPFDTSLVSSRLTDLSVFQEVGELAEYLAIKELRGFRTPSAYVVLAKETGVPKMAGNAGGRQRQIVDVVFGVVIAVRNFRCDIGERADSLDAIIDATRSSILGWTPDLPLARPVQFVNGETLDSDDSTILWGEVYSTQHAIGSNP